MNKINDENEMLEEYDFSDCDRGQFYKDYYVSLKLKDTTPEAEAEYSRRIMAKSPEERLIMACDMFSTANPGPATERLTCSPGQRLD